MSWSPATPDQSGMQEVKHPSHAVVPPLEKHNALAHQVMLHEPSPASTYGNSVGGDSVPATPQAHELNGQSSQILSFSSSASPYHLSTAL